MASMTLGRCVGVYSFIFTFGEPKSRLGTLEPHSDVSLSVVFWSESFDFSGTVHGASQRTPARHRGQFGDRVRMLLSLVPLLSVEAFQQRVANVLRQGVYPRKKCGGRATNREILEADE